MKPVHRLIAIKDIAESPHNPRTAFDEKDLAELAASIEAHGVLENLVVRKGKKKPFEIISGARRLRAAKLAKLEYVPCMIHYDVEDAQALEMQLVENAQRVDISAVEEADAFKRLQDEFKFTVEQIAERTGKNKATVYGRLRLAHLGEKGRKAVESGKLLPSVALYVARMPEKLQGQAVRLLTEWDGVLSARQAAMRLTHMFQGLEKAPWKLDDADLVPAAGSCRACPKRSANIDGLASDLVERLGKETAGNVCTDQECYLVKLRASFQNMAEMPDKNGAMPTVLSRKALSALEGELVNLDGYHDAPTERALKATSKDLPKYIHLNEERLAIQTFVRRDELPKIKRESQSSPGQKADQARRKAGKLKADVTGAVCRRIIEKAVETEKGRRSWAINDLRSVAELLSIDVSDGEALRRRGAKSVLELEDTAVAGYIVESILEAALGRINQYNAEMPEAFKIAADVYRVDVGKVQAQVKADMKNPKTDDKGEGDE